MPGTISFGLEWLIQPIATDVFRSEYWERKPLVLKRNSQTYYSSLFSIADMDCVLSTAQIPSRNVRLIKEGDGISLEDFTKNSALSPNATALDVLYEKHRDGFTIVFQSLQQHSSSVKHLCNSLTEELSAGINVNVYLTPADCGGLPEHYDTHDVFVLQIEGSKIWQLYKPNATLPYVTEQYDATRIDIGEVVEELVLNVGDLLYVPRGVPHQAIAESTTSMHLTIGISTITWGSAYLGAVEAIVRRNALFRNSLPPGFAAKDAQFETALSQSATLCDLLKGQLDPSGIVKDASNEVWISMPIDLDGHLIDLQAVSKISLTTIVFRRSKSTYRLTSENSQINLEFNGKSVQFPSDLTPTIKFMAMAGRFRIGELEGNLDNEEKLLIVKRLVTEGFLTIDHSTIVTD